MSAMPRELLKNDDVFYEMKMNKNKKALYESMMKSISKIVKKQINEAYTRDGHETYEMTVSDCSALVISDPCYVLKDDVYEYDDKVSSVIYNDEQLKTLFKPKGDIKNFFDKYIYIEDEINEIVTTYNDKIASIGFEANKLTLNGSTKKINAHAIKENDVVYIPISEMTDVYNIEIDNIESTKVIMQATCQN